MTETRTHPDVPGCVVRLTDAAIEDLHGLLKVDPQIVRWALKKMIQIERDPLAGAPLLGGLIGYRKLTVGNRDWRVVWRIAQDDVGDYVVEVGEVWAVGYRKDSEVYDEVKARIATADKSAKSTALNEVLRRFSKQARGLSAAREPDAPEPVPKWLRDALLFVVQIDRSLVEEMSLDEAEQTWADYTSGPGASS